MAGANTAIQYSFASGELDYPLRSRVEWERRDQGAELIRNGIVLPTGGAMKRGGTRFAAACLFDDKPSTLIEFEFDADQIYTIELSENLMRVFWRGAPIANASGKDYTVKTPYTAEQSTRLKYVQDQDALFTTHIDVQPYRLVRYSHMDWRWIPQFSDATRIASPVKIEFSGDDGNGHNDYAYAVTSYRQVSGAREESIGYPSIASLSDGSDQIKQVPQKNLNSCLTWLDTYKKKYGNFPGFPTVDVRFLINQLPFDNVTNDIGNPDSDVHYLLFGWMVADGHPDVDWIRQGRDNGEQPWPIFYRYWKHGEGEKYSEDRIYFSEYPDMYTPAPYGWNFYITWFLRDVVVPEMINRDVTLPDGLNLTNGLYNPIMDFIKQYNDKNSPKIYNRVGWPAVPGALGYYLYRRALEGDDTGWKRIADTATATHMDIIEESEPKNIGPIHGENVFTDPKDWPAVLYLFQQRLLYGRTKRKPSSIFGSSVGIYTDFSINPTDDSSGFEFKLSSQKLNAVMELLALQKLIGLTSGGEFINDISGSMSSRNVNMVQQSSAGASDIPAIVIDDFFVRVPRARKSVSVMQYSLQKNGFTEEDLLYFARHLVQNRRIISLAYQRRPHNLLWAVFDDGELASCTFVPDQSILAWTSHDTQGRVSSVKAIPTNDGDDEIWITVFRTLGNGRTRQYIEIIQDPIEHIDNDANGPDRQAEAFYVDSGLSLHSYTEVTKIRGLDHLEGLTVTGLADGNVITPRKVVNGGITLDYPAKVVHAGLPYAFRLRTLDMELSQKAVTLRDTQRQINSVMLDLYVTSDLSYRDPAGKWHDQPKQYVRDWGARLEPCSGPLKLEWLAKDSRGAKVEIKSDKPLPCGILSMLAEIRHGRSA